MDPSWCAGDQWKGRARVGDWRRMLTIPISTEKSCGQSSSGASGAAFFFAHSSLVRSIVTNSGGNVRF